MSFHEVIYKEPIYEEPRIRIVFDPEKLPIRSCLRPEDDLQSCYGPVQKKSVEFCDYFVVIPYVVHDDYVDMSGCKRLPLPRRSKFYRLPPYNFPAGRIRYQNYPPRFNASNIWDYENLFAARRLRSILKKVNKSAESKKAVHFALMQQNLAADDERTETFVTFDPLPDCWKANFRFDCGEYWLNCNLL